MSKNEDRIWDVLIEDAMREQKPEPGDRTRRLLTPVGPVGVDRGRSMRRTRRRKWVSPLVTLGALLLVVGAIYAGITWLPEVAPISQPADSSETAESNTEPKPMNQNPPREQWSPAPNRDQPKQSQPKQLPEPTPEPEPKPDKPESEPIKPDNKPEPQPDERPEPDPAPEPQPEKPDDVVEKPADEPEQPDKTSPTPEPEPGQTIQLLRADKRADLLVSSGIDTETGEPVYEEAGDRTEFANDSWFVCYGSVDLLAGNTFIRLEGKAHIDMHGESIIRISLTGEDMYIDSRGAGQMISVLLDDIAVNAVYGAAFLIERHTSRKDISVYAGETQVDNFGIASDIPAGKRGVLKRKGFGGLFDLNDSWADEPFLEGLTDRVIYRQDFDFGDVTGPDANLEQGRLREGDIKDGVLTGERVFWGFPENVAYKPGLVVRLRVKFSDDGRVSLNQFCEERDDNYSHKFETTAGVWRLIEFPVDQLLERTTHTGTPQPGETFMNFSLQPESGIVEVDWIEFIAAVKQEKK